MKLDLDTKCPNCGQRMRLVHAAPKSQDLPELRTLRCYFCNEAITVAIAEPQPENDSPSSAGPNNSIIGRARLP
jgi:hypothetical protein